MPINFILIWVCCLITACEQVAEISLPIKAKDTLGVTINKASNETVGSCSFTLAPSSANTQGFSYKATFSKAIDTTTFTDSDISNLGTGGGVSLSWDIESCGDNQNFKITASSIVGDGTIVPSLSQGEVLDAAGESTNTSSHSVDNSVAFTKGWYQEAYIKASNNDSGDSFGSSLSLDVDTLVVPAMKIVINQPSQME